MLIFNDETSIWLRPTTLTQLIESKQKYPQSKMIGGNTEVGVEMNILDRDFNSFIYMGDVSSIKTVQINANNDLEIGVNIELNNLIDSLNELKQNKTVCKPWYHSLINSFLSNLKWFASRQIRNFATLAGNITTASPISDLNPILVASNAYLIVISSSSGQKREISMRKFFISYRKIDLKPDEIVLYVRIPLPENPYQIMNAYKQSKRKVDDIAIANGAFYVKLNNNSNEIVSLDISVGGLAPTTIYLSKLNDQTKGLIWGNNQHLDEINKLILNELSISYSAPGANPIYRRTLIVSFFTRFWYLVLKSLPNSDSTNNIEEIKRELTASCQDFQTKQLYKSWESSTIGSVKPHVAAILHTTGKAQYLDDIPPLLNELSTYFVLSKKANALILNIDSREAMEQPGVYAFLTHQDFKTPRHNIYGPLTKDEEYLASNQVLFVGQIVGVIIADSFQREKVAASKVVVNYAESSVPPILTIKDAIQSDSFYSQIMDLEKVETKEDINEECLEFEGECNIGGQEHFYLETQCCLVIPKTDSDELEVIASTQNIAEAQQFISDALEIDSNRITVRCKRLGGGFGGKQSRTTQLCVIAALAAKKLGRPVRCVLERHIDMLITGRRHPYYAKYKCTVTKEGKFRSCDFDVIGDAGHSSDLSWPVLNRAVTHCDNVYNFNNFHVRGRLAKTNTASNTA
jgi:xanthine dehydrogenase/oxidase